ncbi:MAG TPA: phospholipase D-like domain-containing protein, partial [Burkholderiaceae bacterium]|nr:phospholipase D-like domain-containing protein [Burkholderiaceae bacterium]
VGLNHEKLTLLHGQRLTVFGSSNWTKSSADQQNEHNDFTTKPWFYDWSREHFEHKWNNSASYVETKPFAPLPPDTPVYQRPANAATGIGSSTTSRWYGGPWARFYDVYFGTDPISLVKIASNVQLGPSARPRRCRVTASRDCPPTRLTTGRS